MVAELFHEVADLHLVVDAVKAGVYVVLDLLLELCVFADEAFYFGTHEEGGNVERELLPGGGLVSIM